MRKTITKEIEVSGNEVRSISNTYEITKEVDVDEEIEKKNKESVSEYIMQEYEEEFIEEAEKKFREDWENGEFEETYPETELEDVEGDFI